jgi:glutamate dehydrogenase
VTRWAAKEEDAPTRARPAYAGRGGSGEVEVAKVAAGVQMLRNVCHAVAA